MKKITLTLLITFIFCMISSCGPRVRTIQYVKQASVIIDESQTPAMQIINDVGIELRIANIYEIPKLSVRANVAWSYKDKIYTDAQEHTIDIFNGYSVFIVNFMNKSKYDLAMGGYRFLFIGSNGSPDYAINKTNERSPWHPLLENLFNKLMKNYDKTDGDKLRRELSMSYADFMRNLQLINGINGMIFSGTNYSGLLIFKFPLSNTTSGTISIREIVETDRQIARITKTDNYEWRTRLSYNYQKTRLFNEDKYKIVWENISENEYLNNYRNPQTYWYNDTTQQWIEKP